MSVKTKFDSVGLLLNEFIYILALKKFEIMKTLVQKYFYYKSTPKWFLQVFRLGVFYL